MDESLFHRIRSAGLFGTFALVPALRVLLPCRRPRAIALRRGATGAAPG